MKTHKATKKRFRVTTNNKVMHNRQGDNGHLRSKKSYHQKARLDGKEQLGSTNQARKIIKLLGQ